MAVLQRATDLWGDGATIDVIYITGGGASSLGPYLARTYSQAIIVEESHLANVQGYFRFAHILWER